MSQCDTYRGVMALNEQCSLLHQQHGASYTYQSELLRSLLITAQHYNWRLLNY